MESFPVHLMKLAHLKPVKVSLNLGTIVQTLVLLTYAHVCTGMHIHTFSKILNTMLAN